MKAFTIVSGRLGRWMWTPMVVAGLIGISGCKNTSTGTGANTGWPIGGAPQGADPLFGATPAPSTTTPPGGLTPAGHTGAPVSGSIGAVPPPPPSGPLPGFHAPATMGSPAALATGTTGTLANPRDPLAANNATVPTLNAPITNTPVNPVPGGPQPVLLNPVATTPVNTYPQPGSTPPPSGAFGNNPAPSPSGPLPTGPLPSGPLPVPGNNSPPPPDPVPGLGATNPPQTGAINLAGFQQTINQQANLANAKVATAANQVNQAAASYTQQAQSNLNQLQDQLRAQGTALDQSTQATITNLNNSLSQQGMMWQKMQKQADGSWKSIASFSDPKNPANRRTMEAVASTPDSALRALLGEAQAPR